MIYLGQYNQLEVLRFTSVGAYLGDEEGNDILLPNRYVTGQMAEGDKLDVFVYLDSEERPVATTEKPYIELHSFAYLNVVDVNHLGAFLDWGLMKHIFCPYKEQLTKMEEGGTYLVYLYLDEATNRLLVSARIRRFLEREHILVQSGDEVDVLICDRTELGQNVIVNDTYGGLIFTNHLSKSLRKGERTKAYVKEVRPDGKLDISFEKEGYQKIEPAAEELLQILKIHGGMLRLTDKSDPDEIREQVGMSKKTFKQAIGNLYRQRLIVLESDSIRLA